jgi:streptogramin lyase
MLHSWVRLASCWAFGLATVCAAGASLGATSDLLVDSSGTNQILRYDGVTGAFKGVFASGNGLSGTEELTYGPDGNLYVSNATGKDVLRFNGQTGAFLGVFASGGGLSVPIGLTFGPDKNLYVADNNNKVIRYDGTTGAFDKVFLADPGFDGPTDLKFGPANNLFVAGEGVTGVLRFDSAGNPLPSTGNSGATFIPDGTGELDDPFAIIFGPDGHLYVSGPSGTSTSMVLRFDESSGALIDSFVAKGSGGLGQAFGLTFGPDGNLYVASQIDGAIKKYDGKTGASIGDFISPGSGGLNSPNYLTFMPASGVAVPLPAAVLMFPVGVLVAAWSMHRMRRSGALR